MLWLGACSVCVALGLSASAVHSQTSPVRLVNEAFSVGHLGDPVEFAWVRGLRVWGNEVVVLEPRRVVRLSRAGEFLGEIGREGAGPGEFLDAVTLGVWRDTLWVSDLRLRRLTFFSAPGVVARTFTVNTSYAGPDGSTVAVAVPLTDTTYAATTVVNPVMVASGQVSRQYRLIVNDLGIVVDTLLETDMRPHDVGVLESGGSFSQAIRDTPLSQFSAALGRTIKIDRRLPEGAGGYTVEIRDISSGGVVGTIRHTVSPVRVPPGFYDEWLESFDRQTNSLLPLRAVSEALYRPEFFPSVQRVSVGSDGIFWIAHRPVDGEATWDALGADGRRLFQVRLPANHNLRDSDEGGVWTVGTGKLDERFVSYWRYSR